MELSMQSQPSLVKYSILEMSCLNEISKKIFQRLNFKWPPKNCCNASHYIDEAIRQFVDQDEFHKFSIYFRIRNQSNDLHNAFFILDRLQWWEGPVWTGGGIPQGPDRAAAGELYE